MIQKSVVLYSILTALTLALGAICADDLLEEYVRHVGRVNKLHEDDLQSETNDVSTHRGKREIGNDIAWTHYEVLDKEGLVTLRWQPRHQEILFRVEAKTRGYVGIGFSPDGKMQKADIVLGWVDDLFGRPYLMDCHGVPKSQGSAPVKDEIDNYTLMRGIQNDSYTILEFRRVFDTCDPHDFVLSGDTVRIIWAIHNHDPRHGAEMVYHGEKRGSQSVHLLKPPPVPKMPPNHSRHWDVVLENLQLEEELTMYWCKIVKAPTLNSEHHVIGFEPIIGKDHENMVHHMIIHECELDENDDFLTWEKFSKEKGRLCYNDIPQQWEKCLTPLVAWAVGSKGENFPNHIGFPLSNRTHSYFMLEVHFDNPSLKKVTATTGLRLHYTSELRENKGGILITGVVPSNLHFVPPYQKEYKTAGYCSLNCTKEALPKTGINVFSVMLHSHLAARKMKLRHIRAGKELLPLAQDNHYDYNYQQSRLLSQDTLILPEDGLITECTYSTEDRDKPTLGGYSTKEEMCLAFILYYPRVQLAGCYSIPPVKYFFETLGIREFYNKDMMDIEKIILEGSSDTKDEGEDLVKEEKPKENIFDKLIIKDPLEFRNLTFTDHLHNMPYTENLFTQKMEEFFYKGLHLTFCRKRDDSLAIKENIEQLPVFDKYQKKSDVQCSYKTKVALSSQSMPENKANIAVRIQHLLLGIPVFLYILQ